MDSDLSQQPVASVTYPKDLAAKLPWMTAEEFQSYIIADAKMMFEADGARVVGDLIVSNCERDGQPCFEVSAILDGLP